MLKRIPKSDISVRPFKAYKEWSFDQSSTEVSLLEANISSSDLSGLYPKNSIYGQLKSQFYNGDEYNPFNRFGSIRPLYNVDEQSKERFLGDSAKVLSIPQKYIGEGIKKKINKTFLIFFGRINQTSFWMVMGKLLNV